MKILYFLALFTICAIRVNSQSTLPLRADTVVIEKTGGNGFLKVKDSSRNTTGGILTNIGGGVYVGKKPRQNGDTLFIGRDTLLIQSGNPAGADREIQINDAGVFGVQSGVEVTTQGTIVSDSSRNKKYNNTGDSTFSDKIVFFPSKTYKSSSVKASIGYGEENNQYEDSTVNNTLEMRIGSVGGVAGSYIRLGLEKRWKPFPGSPHYWMEAHLPEVRLSDGVSVYRPASWTGQESGDDGTWTHRANLHSFYDWNGQKSLGGFSRGAGEFITYHNYSGNAITEMSVRDTLTGVRAAGIRINGQINAGSRDNTTNIYGQNIEFTWESAPIFRATVPGAFASNFNYVFAIPSSNTGHRLIVNKGSGVFDDVAMWIHNDGRTVVGNANNFWPSYKFQAHNGINSFVFGDWDTDNTTILYSGAFSHRLTAGGGGAGMGAGYRFEADNASNTPTTIADIAGAWSGTPTAGAENGDIIARTTLNGTLQQAFRSYSTGEFSITTIDSVDTPANILWQHPVTKKIMKSAISNSGNFANTNLTFTGDRSHNANNNDLTIGSIKNLNINSIGTFNSRTQYGQILTSPSNGAFPWQIKYGMLNAAGLSDSITSIIVQNVSGITLSSTESGTAKSGIVDIGTDGIVSVTGDSIRLKSVPHSGSGLPDSVFVPGYRQLTGDATQLGASTLYSIPLSRLLRNTVQTLNSQYTTAQNSGTSETDMYTYTMPANTLDADGKSMSFEIDGELNDNTATAQIKLYFAGNTTLNTGAVNINTALTAYRITGRVVRTSSTTAHVTYHMKALGLATDEFLSYNNLTSLDFTTTNIFKITAQAGGAGGGNGDITTHSWKLLYQP